MSLKQRVFNMTMAELGLHTNTTNRLVQKVICPINKFFDSAEGYKEFYEQITVGQIVESLGSYQRHFSPDSSTRVFMKKLLELGLIKADWVLLSKNTITPESLRKWGAHSAILALPAITLPTIDAAMVEVFMDRTPTRLEKYEEVTIEMLLRMDQYFEDVERLESELVNRFLQGIRATRSFMQELFFTFDDGYFMQFRSRRAVLEGVCKRHSLDQEMGELLLTVARSEGWIPAFIE